MAANIPILSILLWLPIFSGIVILKLSNDIYLNFNKIFSLVISIICLALSFLLLKDFDSSTHTLQFIEHISWVSKLDINYSLGIDGFALPLIVLTCIITPLVIINSFASVKFCLSQYLAAFLIMQGLMCGVFMATNSILFYFFWEATLLPMFMIIGVWGGENRVYATIKFFLYTFLGSVLLLVAILYLHNAANNVSFEDTYNIFTFHNLSLSLEEQKWIFLAFLIAFAVKVPMWPVHTWLPDAHVQAPTGGSAILAAVLLKMGGYGFVRFILPITTEACKLWGHWVIFLSLVAIVYIGFVALIQRDMKKLIAYSSISHMGIVTLGFLAVFKLQSAQANLAVQGAMVQMISHGFISAGLFFCVGILYDRMHTKLIDDYGGVTKVMPVFAVLFLFLAMANSGLPGTSGFVGEFMVILSVFQADFWYAFLAATSLILGASYTLWMFKRVMFGTIKHDSVSSLNDLSINEIFVLTTLAFFTLLLGIWPEPLIKIMDSSVGNLVDAYLLK